ncbi:hypothetical protein ACF0HT_14105 (plasmid) [Staphylococcus xylosus]
MINTLMITNSFNAIMNFIMQNHFIQAILGGVLLFGLIYILLEGD